MPDLVLLGEYKDNTFIPVDGFNVTGHLDYLFPLAETKLSQAENRKVSIKNGNFTYSDTIGASYVVDTNSVSVSVAVGSGNDSVNVGAHSGVLVTLGAGADSLDLSGLGNGSVYASDLSVSEGDVLILDGSWTKAKYDKGTKVLTFYAANDGEGAKINLGNTNIDSIKALTTRGNTTKTHLKDYLSPFTEGNDTPDAIIEDSDSEQNALAGDDCFTVQGGSNTIYGGLGNDSIGVNGESYNANTVDGGAGNDSIRISGAAEVSLGAGTDTLVLAAGAVASLYDDISATEDKLFLDGSTDSASYDPNTRTITFQDTNNTKIVLSGSLSPDDIKNLEVTSGSSTKALIEYLINGSAGNDFIKFTTDNETIKGNGGNDTIDINGTGNTIDGGEGDDSIKAQGQNNSVNGGGGKDQITVSGGTGNTVDGGTDNDTITADSGSNTIDGGTGDDSIVATGGSNSISGGDGNDSIRVSGDGNNVEGGAGDDTISVSGENNTVDGGEGSDSIRVGSGKAIVSLSGNGNDSLSFGDSANVTVDSFDANDVIDFSGDATYYITLAKKYSDKL